MNDKLEHIMKDEPERWIDEFLSLVVVMKGLLCYGGDCGKILRKKLQTVWKNLKRRKFTCQEPLS